MSSTADATRTVVLIPGDGIGPEISDAVKKVFAAARVPIRWEEHLISTKNVVPGQDLIPSAVLDSIRRHGYGVKGPLETPIGKGHKSLNLTLRQALGLYANVRPCRTVPGVRTKFDNIDVVIIRENTEGEYVGLEHEVVPGVVESLKIITRSASERVARFAFEFARHNKRRRVTAIHKASVLKLSDGMFLDCCRRIATEYPDIEFKEALIELCSGYLISQPQRYDVLVLTNLAGDIVSDLAAGLVGGLGLTASLNKGEHTVLAEAVHGTAPDIAGKDLANPTALLLSAVLMLREMNLQEHADRIEKAIYAVLEEGKVLTGDLGGKARCSEYTLAIMEKL
jgi:isocitrate dehydrogenase (NAD+)